MKEINPDAQRKPIGGHHFTDRGQIIHSDSFLELVQSLSDFRLANSFPFGEPKEEILAYYAAIAPWLVIDDDVKTRYMGVPAHVKPLREWLNETYRAGSVVLCSKIEAKERWAGCEGCKYASVIDWSYSIEMESLEKKVELLKGMKETPLDDSYCRLHKWATGAATYIKKPKINEINKERSPDSCFVKKL